MTRLEELKAAKAEYDRLKADGAMPIIKEWFRDLFEKFPQVKAVAWTQYTPYFNDGDACVFSKNDMYVTFDDHDDYTELEFDEELRGPWELREEQPELCKYLSDEPPAELFEEMFGDHQKVVATPDGFSAETYSHD